MNYLFDNYNLYKYTYLMIIFIVLIYFFKNNREHYKNQEEIISSITYDNLNLEESIEVLLENDINVYKRKITKGIAGVGNETIETDISFKPEELTQLNLDGLIQTKNKNTMANTSSMVPVLLSIIKQNRDEINKLSESINSMKESIYNLEK
jgi:hypothetical protein